MTNILRKEYIKAKELPRITDGTGLNIFEDILNTCNDSSQAIELYSEADSNRLGATREQHKAAYTYLALAFVLLKNTGVAIQAGGGAIGPDKLFHFAGHSFRKVGQLNRAADAYWRAGVISSCDADLSPFGIRSIARAKICFAEVGETQKSDNMHILEWEGRRQMARCWQKPVLYLWMATSQYGTAVGRWLLFMFGAVGVFTVVYEIMHSLLWIHQEQEWTPWFSALYYCVVTMTTLGYGEFVPSHPVAQAFVVLNVLVGYYLLAIGVTILGRKVIAR